MGAKKIPPPSPYCGLYRCTSDDLLYQVEHTDSNNTDMQMRRRRDDEDWRPACPVNTDPKHNQLQRLLDYGSFIRIE